MVKLRVRFFRPLYTSRNGVLEVEVSLAAGIYDPVKACRRHDLSMGMAREVDVYIGSQTRKSVCADVAHIAFNEDFLQICHAGEGIVINGSDVLVKTVPFQYGRQLVVRIAKIETE